MLDIIIGFLNFIFIEDTKHEEQKESLGQVVTGMLKTLLLPRVWLLIAIVFTAYSVYGLVSYATTYAQEFFGMTAATAATLGGIRYLIQGLGGIVAGFVADRLSRAKVIVIGSIGMAVSFALYIFIPVQAGLLGLIIFNFFFGLFFIYAVRSQYFAIHDDAGIPLRLSGRVSGIASAVGFLPDVFMFTIVGGWMDNYGHTGYNMTWIYAIVMAILCGIITIILTKTVKDKLPE